MSGRRAPFWRRESGRTRLGYFASWGTFGAVTISTFAFGIFLIVQPLHLKDVPLLLAVVAVLVAALGAGALSGVAVGSLADRIHRFLWPKHTEDGHD